MDAISLAVAFGAGVISITSPCCLPLLPGYLAYLSGVSIGEAQATARRRTVIAATLFVAGFSLVVMALGATASELGALLLNYRFPLSRIAGVLILVMGLVLVLEARVGWLSRGGDWPRSRSPGLPASDRSSPPSSRWPGPLLSSSRESSCSPPTASASVCRSLLSAFQFRGCVQSLDGSVAVPRWCREWPESSSRRWERCCSPTAGCR
ncbi:MAG: hypothetical protein E6J28_14050 [Chloroflexi bacterium]|nr:MAG: hypothetical protein E6J28_14050 [Chloroflexota bacterium]